MAMLKKKLHLSRSQRRKTIKNLEAEKTEVLNDDLLQVEKRMELVRQVSHSTHKKLIACLQGQQGGDVDRRSTRSPLGQKKHPLEMLAQCLQEGADALGDDSLLGRMLKLCGEAQDLLAQELLQFELQMEKNIIEPLYTLAEVEIPDIQKQRKNLAKLVLDMDSARTRWQQSSKSLNVSNKEQSLGAKADALKEELEEVANRMEIYRDQLTANLYNFVAKETNYANYFQTLIEVQAEYHKKSLERLQNVIPQIKVQQELWAEGPCFGKPLEEHLSASARDIAFPIEACVTVLLEFGLQEEGLFRVAPAASKLRKLKASLDCGFLDMQEYSSDPHAVAGALKSYLRELPEPLLTFDLYDEWIQASNVQNQEKRLQKLLQVCEKLPQANSNNFRYLVKFLAKLTEHEGVNKMTTGNIAIVLGPNLLWPQTEGTVTDMITTLSLHTVQIIEPIIQNADWFFPGEMDFNVTDLYGSSFHMRCNSDPGSDLRTVAMNDTMQEFSRTDSALNRSDLSPVIRRRGLQMLPPGGQTQPAQNSPPTLQKVGKKLSHGSSKGPSALSSSASVPSLAQSSAVSLSPATSSRSSHGFYATVSSPGLNTPNVLASPRLLSATLPKNCLTSRPPRNRPSLPQTCPPIPLPEHSISAAEGSQFSLDLPIILVQEVSQDQSSSTPCGVSVPLCNLDKEWESTKL